MSVMVGEDIILKNLSKSIKNIRGDIRKGLAIAGSDILNDAKDNVPEEFSVLINSGYMKPTRARVRPAVYVGFTAEYAAAVHEMPMVNKGKPRRGLVNGKPRKGSYWDKGRNKYLILAVTSSVRRTLRTIRRFAKR